MSQQIPVYVPFIGDEEAAAVARVLKSRWLTQGPEVGEFEREFAAFVGAPEACAVSNCTTALHLALLAVGVGPGDEVVTASHSFVATANAIRYCGALPVFADVDERTLNLDPEAVGRLVTPRTRAILAVHQIGMPCDLAGLKAVADRHRLALVEDAACAVGSEILWEGRWERIGKPHGDLACFSFHPRKLLTTGEGGMVTARDPAHAARIRLLRQHGMSVTDAARHQASRAVFEEYLEVGYNYRMSDLNAAVGRVQLRLLPGILARRREQVERYRELFARRLPEWGFPVEPSWARSSWQSLHVTPPDRVGQRELLDRGLAEGIHFRRAVMTSHREPAYPPGTWGCEGRPGGAEPCSRGCAPGACSALARSEAARDHGILIPLFHEMTDEMQDRVVDLLSRAGGA